MNNNIKNKIMGRSIITCASNGDVVYCEYEREEWEDFAEILDNELYFLMDVLPSLGEVHKRDWMNNECCRVAQNGLYAVYISTYYDIIAYSFVSLAEIGEAEWNTIGLANRSMELAAAKLEKRLGSSAIRRMGTFSNGESVYSRVN